MNVPIANNMPQVTLSIVAFITTVLFADASVTPPTIVQTDNLLSAMTLDMLSETVPSLRTPAVVSSSMMETWRGSNHVLVVQVFEGGIITIHGDNLLFSIVHLPPLSSDLPYSFTISIMFLTNNYWYIVW